MALVFGKARRTTKLIDGGHRGLWAYKHSVSCR